MNWIVSPCVGAACFGSPVNTLDAKLNVLGSFLSEIIMCDYLMMANDGDPYRQSTLEQYMQLTKPWTTRDNPATNVGPNCK